MSGPHLKDAPFPVQQKFGVIDEQGGSQLGHGGKGLEFPQVFLPGCGRFLDEIPAEQSAAA